MLNHHSTALPSHEILSKLACDDPQAFEALREELVACLIRKAPERIRPRLYGIQFRINAIRRLSRTPLGALVKIQAMMWSSFLRMDEELQRFAGTADNRARVCSKQTGLGRVPSESARVIEFRPRLFAERR